MEQKDAMQLIGTWGYTPSRLESYLTEQQTRAKEIGDSIGATMYASMITLCKYATSGDATGSVRPDKLKPSDDAVIEILKDYNIKDLLEDKRFPDEVLNSIFDSCEHCKTFHEAELIMREQVMFIVAPIVVENFIKIGSELTEQLMECLVGTDHAIQSSGEVRDEIKDASKALGMFIDSIIKYSDEMKKCTDTSFDQFNDLAKAIFGDVGELINEINQDMLSIIDQPPHVWTSYSLSFGRVMVAFMMAMSFGYITYDDYESLIFKFKQLKKTSENHDKLNVIFGRN